MHLVDAIDICPSECQLLRRRPQVEEHSVVQGAQTCLQVCLVMFAGPEKWRRGRSWAALVASAEWGPDA